MAMLLLVYGIDAGHTIEKKLDEPGVSRSRRQKKLVEPGGLFFTGLPAQNPIRSGSIAEQADDGVLWNIPPKKRATDKGQTAASSTESRNGPAGFEVTPKS